MSEPNTTPTADDAEPLDFKATHTYRSWKHTAPLLGCRYDPTARYVFASSMDQAIHRWDLQEDLHATFTGHESWLRGIGFSPDASTMYSAGYDGRLCFWQTTAASQEGVAISPTRTIDAHKGWIRWLAVSPDGNLIATAGNDLKINLWAAGSGELVNTLLGHHGPYFQSVVPSGRRTTFKRRSKRRRQSMGTCHRQTATINRRQAIAYVPRWTTS